MITITALMAAMICVVTLVVKIPTPTKGYLNLGDCFVLLSGWLLGTGYGFLAGGIGSAFADLLAGYPIYIPGTFVIKGLMAFVFAVILQKMQKDKDGISRLSWILSAVCAEAVMVSGYYLYEAVIIGEGFYPAFAGVFGNVMQGLVGFVSAFFVAEAMRRTGIYEKCRAYGFGKER